jgi:hypothetical protein
MRSITASLLLAFPCAFPLMATAAQPTTREAWDASSTSEQLRFAEPMRSSASAECLRLGGESCSLAKEIDGFIADNAWFNSAAPGFNERCTKRAAEIVIALSPLASTLAGKTITATVEHSGRRYGSAASVEVQHITLHHAACAGGNSQLASIVAHELGHIVSAARALNLAKPKERNLAAWADSPGEIAATAIGMQLLHDVMPHVRFPVSIDRGGFGDGDADPTMVTHADRALSVRVQQLLGAH